MPWFKIDDTFAAHPKVAELESGPCFAQAVALWTLAGSWCASQLTDGNVPASALRRLVPFDGRKAAAELVRVGLWSETADGFSFRDWTHYQPTKAEVESARESTVARSRKYRERKREREAASRDGDATVTRDAGVTSRPRHAAPSRPDPSRSDSPPGGGESRERATPAAAPVEAAQVPEHVERFAASFDAPTDAERQIRELVSQIRGVPFRGTSFRDREAVSRLARWASCPEIGMGAAGVALRAFFAAKGTGAALSWMVEEDPGRWLGTPPPKRGRQAPVATHEEHAAVVEAAGNGRDHAIVTF